MRLLLILLFVPSVFALFFLLLSYISPLYKNNLRERLSNPPQASAYFKPRVITSDCNNTSLSAKIFINTMKTPITSAQIELKYDTDIIYNFSIKPSDDNLFQTYLKEENIIEVRKDYGRSSFVISSNESFAGNKAVADISFNVNSPYASASTQIKLLNKSTAIKENSRESVLKETIPLTIFCQ